MLFPFFWGYFLKSLNGGILNKCYGDVTLTIRDKTATGNITSGNFRKNKIQVKYVTRLREIRKSIFIFCFRFAYCDMTCSNDWLAMC